MNNNNIEMPQPIIVMDKICRYQGALNQHLDKLTRPQRVITKIGKFMVDIMEVFGMELPM